MSSAAVSESTWEERLSGLCELCEKEAAEIECNACGPVRLNKTGAFKFHDSIKTHVHHINLNTDDGPLLLCTECSASLHTRGVFKSHKLITLSRKVRCVRNDY